MRHFDNHLLTVRQDLKARGNLCIEQTTADVLRRYGQALMQRIERGQARCRIGELISAAQRRVWQSVSFAARAPVLPLAYGGDAAKIALDQH